MTWAITAKTKTSFNKESDELSQSWRIKGGGSAMRALAFYESMIQ